MDKINNLTNITNIKLTSARKSILELLIKANKPLSYEDMKDNTELYATDLYYITKFIKEIKNKEKIVNIESYQFGYAATYQEALVKFIMK